MEALTARQRYNRRYYAKHSERIKAQKRADYANRNKVKPVRKTASSEPDAKKVTAKTELKKTVRSKIEDFELAKELGIEITDL